MNISPFLDPEKNPPLKDGTFLILLVKRVDDNDNWHPTEDNEVFRTIGFNNFDNTGEDYWMCVGWCWCQDVFIETTGEIIGWLPMPDMPKCFLQA